MGGGAASVVVVEGPGVLSSVMVELVAEAVVVVESMVVATVPVAQAVTTMRTTAPNLLIWAR